MLTRINCSGKGCEAFIETSESVSPNATYTCRVHTGKDTKNVNLHFQNHQFDKDLRRSGKPLGTDHIRRQGSEIDEYVRQQEAELKEKGLI